MAVYLITTTLLFAALFVMWKRSDGLNTTFKALLFGLTGYGLLLTLHWFGFIVRQ